MPHSEKPWTTPQIAFDPLKEVSKEAEPLNLSLELQLSLGSSLDALAQAELSSSTPDEAPDGQELFDLDETDAADSDGIASFADGNRARPSGAFNLRNVVVPCGLVFGCLVLLWTRDLMSPALGSAPSVIENRQTPRSALTLAPQTTEGETSTLPTLQPVAPPIPTMVVNNATTVPATSHIVAQVTGRQRQTSGSLLTKTTAPTQKAQNSTQDKPHSRESEQTTVQADRAQLSIAQDTNMSLASSGGGPLNPISAPRSVSAPVVALPLEEPTMGAPMAPEINVHVLPQQSTDAQANSKNKPSKRRRPHPGTLEPKGAPMTWRRNKKERPAPPAGLAFSEKSNR